MRKFVNPLKEIHLFLAFCFYNEKYYLLEVQNESIF